MAETRDDLDIFWVNPVNRGILPIAGIHLSRSMRRRLRRNDYKITTNQAFADVVTGCADRKETWINDQIFDLYAEIHQNGHAHSVEIWQDGKLSGGIYGVTLGSAFFGESMFSKRTDASKTALAFLATRLRLTGFTLFDTQFLTSHLASLGGMEVPRQTYKRLLNKALLCDADFLSLKQEVTVDQVLVHCSSHTS